MANSRAMGIMLFVMPTGALCPGRMNLIHSFKIRNYFFLLGWRLPVSVFVLHFCLKQYGTLLSIPCVLCYQFVSCFSIWTPL